MKSDLISNFKGFKHKHWLIFSTCRTVYKKKRTGIIISNFFLDSVLAIFGRFYVAPTQEDLSCLSIISGMSWHLNKTIDVSKASWIVSSNERIQSPRKDRTHSGGEQRWGAVDLKSKTLTTRQYSPLFYSPFLFIFIFSLNLNVLSIKYCIKNSYNDFII